MDFLHVSMEDHGHRVLWQPRRPYTCEPDGIEDHTPRVCFSPTVEQCMMAASPFSIRTYKQIKPRWPDPELRAEPWYVYRLVLPARVVGPSAAYVHDVMYTDEHWVLEPCEVKKVGRILVQWRAVEASDPVEWWWWA